MSGFRLPSYREADSVWPGDFEGHWLRIDDVDDELLVEIRKMTLEAMGDPILLFSSRSCGIRPISCGASTPRCEGVHLPTTNPKFQRAVR